MPCYAMIAECAWEDVSALSRHIYRERKMHTRSLYRLAWEAVGHAFIWGGTCKTASDQGKLN